MCTPISIKSSISKLLSAITESPGSKRSRSPLFLVSNTFNLGIGKKQKLLHLLGIYPLMLYKCYHSYSYKKSFVEVLVALAAQCKFL